MSSIASVTTVYTDESTNNQKKFRFIVELQAVQHPSTRGPTHGVEERNPAHLLRSAGDEGGAARRGHLLHPQLEH